MRKAISLMRISWLRSSPSFIVAVIVVLGLVGAYAWRWSRPGPRLLSDRVVSDFVTAAYREVREYRRSVGQMADGVKPDGDVANVMQQIERVTADALGKVERHAEEALRRLGGIDKLAWRTEQNRRARIRARLREIKEVLAEVRRETEAEIRGAPTDGASEKR